MISAYLREWVHAEATDDTKGFQFALARATGYDTATTPEMIFVSPYTPMDPAPVPTRPRIQQPVDRTPSRHAS